MSKRFKKKVIDFLKCEKYDLQGGFNQNWEWGISVSVFKRQKTSSDLNRKYFF